ncbi:hypothetical protein [Candidatus Thiodiazotropha sp. LNASS1]|uniref:hypothetical protein n=1 Tax=Candidatus Thiodiazotropha sp. LNASS1 TaxID=3096260 RepID=UPI00348EAD2A
MKGVVGVAKSHSKLIWPTSTVGQNWTFSYKSNMAPEGAANGIIYAIFLRLAIPIKPTKLEPKRHTSDHTSFYNKRI